MSLVIAYIRFVLCTKASYSILASCRLLAPFLGLSAHLLSIFACKWSFLLQFFLPHRFEYTLYALASSQLNIASIVASFTVLARSARSIRFALEAVMNISALSCRKHFL